MIRGNNYGALRRHVSQSPNFGTKGKHQEGSEESSQGSVRQVVEHGVNLLVIADYDTI